MFRGSMVAVVTPMEVGFGPDTSVDSTALARVVEYHIENDTDAIVAVGTTGESATLDEEEHIDVIRQVVEQVNKRIPVIAGTGANSTSEAIRLTQAALDVGADAALLVTPYYNKPTQEGLYQHYKTIAEAVNIPIILYNVPGRTACDMLPETIGRLSHINNIIGVKEATGELDRVAEIKKLVDDDFLIISGDDATTVEFILKGGHGTISVTANVAPKKMHDMCKAALEGDADTAFAIDQKLQGLHKELFTESNPIPVKWAVHKMGLMDAGLRLPLTWMSESCETAMFQAMERAEVKLS